MKKKEDLKNIQVFAFDGFLEFDGSLELMEGPKEFSKFIRSLKFLIQFLRGF